MEDLKKYIRSVPDFPKPGINFYDITTLVQDASGFKQALDAMEAYVRTKSPTRIVGIESRGFIFAAALADRLGVGLSLARKSGKLPYKTIEEVYDLEYGSDGVVMHIDTVRKNDKVVIVDDLLATGGTMQAVCRLVERLGGEVKGISTLIGLTFLPFENLLGAYDVNYLISYDSE